MFTFVNMIQDKTKIKQEKEARTVKGKKKTKQEDV
jgi:hypothetical protein